MTDYNEATITVPVAALADLVTLGAGGIMLDQMVGGTASDNLGESFQTIANAVDALVLSEVDPTTIPTEIAIVFEARSRVLAGEDEAEVDAWQTSEYVKLAEQADQEHREQLQQAYTAPRDEV